MHESVRAKEIENAIREKARKNNIKNIEKVVVKVGRGDGESPSDIRHIIEEHMGLENFEIIEEDIVLICTGCKKTYTDLEKLRCPECNSASFDIKKGMGFEVVSVE
ncbi:MAG: hydrogenase/urease maturation nickel metallochaperone HypA [Elusimicrobiota bacterium]